MPVYVEETPLLKRKMDAKSLAMALGGLALLIILALLIYFRLQGGKVAGVEKQRDWTVNREMGIPLNAGADEGATPEEREASRNAAIETLQSQYMNRGDGKSPVKQQEAYPQGGQGY